MNFLYPEFEVVRNATKLHHTAKFANNNAPTAYTAGMKNSGRCSA